jgi:ssDNA thymidine ADP-ribosyltransferase, DarT
MLFTIHKGNVEQYKGGQTPILHLVSSSSAVRNAQLPFTFTEGHAEMGYSDFFSDLDDLDKIDWGVMRAVYWNDTDEDGDRKRKRQAEFLIHQFFPWNLIERIGVVDNDTRQAVEAILANREHRPTVTVRRDWYY